MKENEAALTEALDEYLELMNISYNSAMAVPKIQGRDFFSPRKKLFSRDSRRYGFCKEFEGQEHEERSCRVLRR